VRNGYAFGAADICIVPPRALSGGLLGRTEPDAGVRAGGGTDAGAPLLGRALIVVGLAFASGNEEGLTGFGFGVAVPAEGNVVAPIFAGRLSARPGVGAATAMRGEGPGAAGGGRTVGGRDGGANAVGRLGEASGGGGAGITGSGAATSGGLGVTEGAPVAILRSAAARASANARSSAPASDADSEARLTQRMASRTSPRFHIA
jgi:hypothetical protein